MIAQADVSRYSEMATVFDKAIDAFGGVDVLVNNAGIMALGPIAETEDAAWIDR